MAHNGIRIVDVDTHVLEPTAIWERYLPPEYRVPARSAFWHEVDGRGLEVTIVNGEPARSMSQTGVNRQAIWRPGMTPSQIGALDPHTRHPANPGAWDPEARLRDMDAMGVDCHLIFPTLFAEHLPVVVNPDIAAALARAYNDWIWDFSRSAPARLVPVAILPMQEVSFAVREVLRVAERGFRSVFIRPVFVNGRFPNHRCYDPLWRELAARDLTVCFHPSVGNTNPEWASLGSFVERVAGNLRIGHDVAEATAPTMDAAMMLTALCFYGHMEEYPRLRLAFVHAGASWVPLTLEKAETYLWLLSAIQDVSLEPEQVFFSRPCLVSFPSWESSVPRMPDVFGEVAAWGSRYPHHDASEPSEVEALCRRHGLSADVQAKLLAGNADRIFGLR
jgi:predicted TIM-barrel fold metal-dependent hydrolase